MIFCRKEEQLFSAYQQAVMDWKQATIFGEAQAKFSAAFYQALTTMEKRKAQALAAKEAYDEHAAQHGCDAETQMKRLEAVH